MTRMLVTGFNPFDGRAVNASWIVASEIARRGFASALELPVLWGKPHQLLQEYCDRYSPVTILSIGEGNPDSFAIETTARNARKHRQDNGERYPDPVLVEESGPDRRITSFDTGSLASSLSQWYPIRQSDDAGQFLCEETLYVLEGLREQHCELKHVLFIHVPPYGSELQWHDSIQACDNRYYQQFAHDLIEAVSPLISDSAGELAVNP